MTDINFSAAIGAATPADAADGPLWSFNGVKLLAGPGGSVILHKLRGDRRVMVQPDVAEALRQCGPFRTVEAHTRRVVESSPLLKEHAEHTQQTLQGLADSGIFESSDACWRRLTQGDTPRLEQTACRVFVLTCDRPAALDRLLSGLREFPLPSPVEGVWIIDDSRDGENVKKNAGIIEAQAEGAKVPVVHVDLTFREDLIQHLKSALPEYRHCVEWFLERSVWGAQPTYGLARNIALLLSVGKRALLLDDDIIPQAIAPPLAARTLHFATPNEREAQFYASREALTEHALPLPDSPTSATTSPRWTSNETRCAARRVWALKVPPRRKCTARSSTRSSGAVMAPPAAAHPAVRDDKPRDGSHPPIPARVDRAGLVSKGAAGRKPTARSPVVG